MEIFAIRSEGNKVPNRIVGSNRVRNVRNERPPLRPIIQWTFPIFRPGVGYAVRRGEKIAKEYKYQLYEWVIYLFMYVPPSHRKIFNEWFDVECHTLIIDTVEDTIEDDGT